MKLRLAFASLLVLSACSTSQEAMQALTAMQFLENGKAEGISYEKLSGSGNDVTLSGVKFLGGPESVAIGADNALTPAPAGAGPMVAFQAESVKFNGLTMKDGKPVFRDMMVNAITPGATMMPPGTPVMKLGSVVLEGLNEASGRFIAGSFTKDGPGEMPPFEQWEFRKISLNGLNVAGPVEQAEAPPGSVSISLDEISVSNLKDQLVGLTRFGALKGEVNVPGMPPVAGKFDLGTFDIANVQAGSYVKAISAATASMMSGGAPDIAAMMKDWTSPLDPWYDRTTWTGAAVDLSGLKLNASPAEHAITRNAEGIAIASHKPRSTIAVTADSAGGTLGAMGLMMLAMTGYPSNVVEIYSEGHATFDPAKDVTHWQDYNVGITDAVDLKISGGLIGLQTALPTLLTSLANGVSSMAAVMPSAEEGADGEDGEKSDDGEESQEAPPVDQAAVQQAATGMVMSMMMGLISLQVTDLDIAVTDKTLVNFILTQTAMQSGQSVAAMREDLVNMVTQAGADVGAMGIDPELVTELTTAVAGLLKGPGTLRLQLKPAAPIGMMGLMMAPPTKASLGFSATFTPAQ